MEYAKWIALDPIQVVNYANDKEGDDSTPADASTAIGMRRQYNGNEELIFIIPVEDVSTNKPGDEQESEESEGKDTAEYQPDLAINEAGEEGPEQADAKKVAKIEFVTKDEQNNDIVNVITPQDKEMSVEAVKNLLKGDAITDNKFEEIPAEAIQGKKEDASKIQTKVESDNKSQDDIVDIINHKTETGNNNDDNSDLTKDKVAEALKQNVETIASNIIKVCVVDPSKFEYRTGGPGEYGYNKVKLYHGPKIPVLTGVKTTKDNDIAVHTELFLQDITNTTNKEQIVNALKNNTISLKNEYNPQTPIVVDNNGNVSVFKNNLKGRLYFVKIVDGKEISDAAIGRNSVIVGGNSEQELLMNIKKGLEQLIISYTSEKSNIQENKEDVLESIKLEYTHSAVNESMTAVKLVRNAVFESNKNAYLVSMTCWGDGSRHNPAKFLEESVKAVVYTAGSYSDIAKSAKKDKNLSILPLTESVTYQVPMPYNRYAILTNGNPLYEAVAVITIDATPDHNITSSKFIGVTRIVK